MTEQEYIDLCDLERVSIAYDLLSKVIPDRNPTIPKEEYLMVVRAIDGWLRKLFKKQNIKG